MDVFKVKIQSSGCTIGVRDGGPIEARLTFYPALQRARAAEYTPGVNHQGAKMDLAQAPRRLTGFYSSFSLFPHFWQLRSTIGQTAWQFMILPYP